MTEHTEPPDAAETNTEQRGDTADGDDEDPLPASVTEEAERLTRLAREAVDENEAAAYRAERADLLAAHDYTDRVREEDDVLVLYPDEWVEDGVVKTDRIEDIDRGIEINLEGPGDPDEWSALAEHNLGIAETVRERHGDVHGANAEAFAEFLNNHYAKPIEDATAAEKEEFLSEYYPRNAWPTDEQRAVIDESLSLVAEVAASVSDTPR